MRDMKLLVEQKTHVEPALCWLMVLHQYSRREELIAAFNQLALQRQEVEMIAATLDIDSLIHKLSITQMPVADAYQLLAVFDRSALDVALVRANSKSRQRIKRFLTQDQYFQLQVSGEDLKVMGVSQGVVIKKILTALMVRCLNEQVLTKAGQLTIAKELVRVLC